MAAFDTSATRFPVDWHQGGTHWVESGVHCCPPLNDEVNSRNWMSPAVRGCSGVSGWSPKGETSSVVLATPGGGFGTPSHPVLPGETPVRGARAAVSMPQLSDLGYQAIVSEQLCF
jgi:hypothetical protein